MMKQSTLIQIPTPIHAQLKALAMKRGTTMVEVIHGAVRDAIAAGELPDEVPGLKVRLELDLDAEDHGPWVIITTPSGDLPRMTREDAEAVARNLCREATGDDEIDSTRANRNGIWSVGVQGTSVELLGKHPNQPIEKAVRVVMTPAIARDFARQVRRAAEGAVHDIED